MITLLETDMSYTTKYIVSSYKSWPFFVNGIFSTIKGIEKKENYYPTEMISEIRDWHVLHHWTYCSHIYIYMYDEINACIQLFKNV